VVDVSGSGRFGSQEQSKRELAAEIASVLAFSAIRNNDKVGLVLFSDEVEKYIPPRKGRKHVLRVIREVLFFEPQRRGTNLPGALDFANRMLAHKAIMVVVSDFLAPSKAPQPTDARNFQTAIKQANRRHDLVTVRITDPHEVELPALGRLILEDAESGEVVEVNTSSDANRNAFALRQYRNQEELAKMFRSAGVDSIGLRTDQPYGAALGRFFETREKRRLRG